MLRAYLITVALVAPLAACGSTHKTVTTAEVTRVEPNVRAPDKTSSDVPSDLRDAMLVLRRVHFSYASATLQPAARDALAQAAEPLRKHVDVQLYIDGHSDVRGTSVYNHELGVRRANAVVAVLTNLGIAADRLHVNSFGKDQLLVNGGGVVAHATNRRVDFRLIRGDVRLVLEDGVLFDDDGNLLGGRTADADALPPQ